MAEYNPKFRDLEQRLNQAREMSETVILGGGGGGEQGQGEGGDAATDVAIAGDDQLLPATHRFSPSPDFC